jgi:short-subunit dehydrogenase
VLSLATSLPSELRKDKIRVHAVCPDGVNTAMVDGMANDGDVRAALAAGVLFTPAQVARELVDMFGTRRVYKTLPAWRGALARSGSALPSAFMYVDPLIRKIGARRLRKAGIR